MKDYEDILYHSILSDVEENISNGDTILDPFNMLEVIDISVVNDISSVVEKIDLDNLFNETDSFDIDKWEYLVNTDKYLLVSEDIKNIIIRLAWWLCREITCVQYNYEKDIHIKIDINSIFPLHNRTNFYIYKYTTNPDIYKMVIDLPGKDVKLSIKFCNTEYL